MPKSGAAALIVAALVMSGGFTQAAFAATATPDATTQQPVTADASPSQDPAPVSDAVEAPAPTVTEKAEAPAPTPIETSDPAPAESTDPTPSAQPDNSDSAPVPAEQPVARVAAPDQVTPSDKPTSTPKKVYVCKYVGTPGVNERLQTGQNPISVSVNSIKNWDGVIPGYFADAQGRSYAFAYNEGQAEPDVSACPTPVVPPVVVKKEVAAYIYPLINPSKPASWQNSGKQVFCESKTGDTWFTTLDCVLPPEVCGAGWGVQQDKVKDWTYDGAFNWPASIQYPIDNIGWPPIYASKHGLLSELTDVPDCTPPPVVIAPTATIQHVCTADAPDVTYELIAGTNDATFQILLNGDQTEERTVKAGEKYEGTITLGEDAFGGSATVEVKSGEASLTGVVTVSTDCAPPVTVIPMPPKPTVIPPTCEADGSLPTLVGGDGYTVSYDRVYDGPGLYRAIFASNPGVEFPHGSITVTYDLTVGGKLTGEACAPPVVEVHPESPWGHDMCGVSDDSVNIPGTPSTTNPNEYTSDQGVYTSVETTKDGARIVQVTFTPSGDATIAAPDSEDTYTVIDSKHAQWTFTFTNEPCPLTVIPMPPKPTVIPPTCEADGSLPTLVGGDGYTVSYDRVYDGPGLYRAIFASNPGVEFPHGSITVTYDLTVGGKLTGGTCPTSTPTPTPTPVPTPASTTPPTTLSSNGGANTGLYGDQPGSSASSWSVGSIWTLGFGALLALLGAALASVVWYRRKRA